MDRLICGDVGFGKTELAIRSLALAAGNGRQAALVAPTTVLAEQHFAVLCNRMAGLPVRIVHMSRLTKSADKETLAAIAEGKVDIVVGTHRALGKDIQWNDLGLMIVDEEQKFGVAHKERLKELRPKVDVLAMSATPIPRTLYLSLSGLRSLSLLTRPPAGRQPILTTVGPYQDEQLVEALQRELGRGGQVYVVHNRVQSLRRVLERVRELLGRAGFPEASLAMAHGQMNEEELAETMTQFLAGHIQVLVASAIVENGLDSPGANTLAVLHAERFGLADLYQLRGRVGRRQEQAHAYFFVGGIDTYDLDLPEEERHELHLGTKAKERLHVLEEADQLGSGWSVALRDMEIRGSGNLLGVEQHGNLEAIGLLLYSQLLQEEIGRQAHDLGIPLVRAWSRGNTLSTEEGELEWWRDPDLETRAT
jgi:transcription-repair coupling factor (superfamily II helicase)